MLTVEEFAREVGATPQEIAVWLSMMLYEHTIGPSQHSKWTLNREPLPPALIRFYLRRRANLPLEVPMKRPRAIPLPKRGRVARKG